jgi:hypothetical protein
LNRYRVLRFDFDTRAQLLSREIEDSGEPKVQELWRQNKELIKEDLLCEFGPISGNMKIENFIRMGPAPFSIVGFHNKFMHQLRNAFIIAHV